MPRYCIVCRKFDTIHQNLTFHRFPSDPDRRNLWIKILGFRNKTLPKRVDICSEHFNSNDIRSRSDGCQVLRQSAVPKTSRSSPKSLLKVGKLVPSPPGENTGVTSQVSPNSQQIQCEKCGHETFSSVSSAIVETIIPQLSPENGRNSSQNETFSAVEKDNVVDDNQVLPTVEIPSEEEFESETDTSSDSSRTNSASEFPEESVIEQNSSDIMKEKQIPVIRSVPPPLVKMPSPGVTPQVSPHTRQIKCENETLRGVVTYNIGRREITVNDIQKLPTVRILPYEGLNSENESSGDLSGTDTASEVGEGTTTEQNFSDILTKKPIPAVLSDSATDSACASSATSPFSLADERSLSPEIQREVTLSSQERWPIKETPKLDAKVTLGNLSEERLIELLEAESPLLTPELLFSKNVCRRRKHFFGDISLNDFKTEEGKKFFIMAAKRVRDDKRKIRTLEGKNRRWKYRLQKMNSMLNVIASLCDVSEAKKILEGDYDDDGSSSDSSTSNEGDIHNKESSLRESDPVAYEKEETQINCFDVANQVQVTFLPGDDSVKESSLTQQLKQFASKEIKKSKKIRTLNNTIFKKNNVIDDLKSEIEKLKENISSV